MVDAYQMWDVRKLPGGDNTCMIYWGLLLL